ncbi:MAG TPA: hypothetical protein VNA68_01610 [Candidatus Dormibacteraeota bacterium]|nr:hypothetical protein [Candidatus Dormibacteraeota bacterium]
MRDELWLQQLLDETWDKYFADVPQDNIVRIKFGRRARTRLGSIRIHPDHPDTTEITLNGLFRDPAVPEFVVLATLVHEMIHYAHGFNSPLEQKHRHPHAGGVVRAEYRERGLEELYLRQKKWLKANWPDILRANFQPVKRRIVKRTIPKPFWF